MICQYLISIFTLFPSWKNYNHHLIASIPNRLLVQETTTRSTASSQSRELWSPAAECTAWLEKLSEPAISFPAVCIYWAADSAWGQLASLVGCTWAMQVTLSKLMPLEFDKKKEFMRTQVKSECQQAGKKNLLLFHWFGTVLLLHLVCVSPPLFEERKKKTHLILKQFACNTCQLTLTRERWMEEILWTYLQKGQSSTTSNPNIPALCL